MRLRPELRLHERRAGLLVRLSPASPQVAPVPARPAFRLGHSLAVLAYLAVTLHLLVACAPLSWRSDPLGLNFVAATPAIGTAGMPQRDQFEAIARAGYRTVINLAPPDALGRHRDEAELAAGAGMRYYNVPVDFARPTADDYRRFAALMRQHAGERVFVHCQLNLRASSFVFLYRVLELADDADRAYDDVARVWEPAPQWRSFMQEMLAQRSARPPMALQG
jgi:protein tyrosine phosphatase (PTP) superfamily phosphohydrolase (DUF442 family)